MQDRPEWILARRAAKIKTKEAAAKYQELLEAGVLDEMKARHGAQMYASGRHDQTAYVLHDSVLYRIQVPARQAWAEEESVKEEV